MPDKKSMREHFIPAIIEDFHGYVSYTPFFLPEEEYRKISGQSEKDQQIPTNPSVGCWCGSFYSINPEGEVSPCALLSDHASGGNVLKQNLEDILKRSELFTKIMKRDELGGKCGKCKFRFTCGGCRAMALYHTGDIYGEDPTCFIDDLTEEELKKMEETTIRNFGKFAKMAQMGKTFLPPEVKE
jgi:radical SAM protein with 4Fe4S-binding SPASM domain